MIILKFLVFTLLLSGFTLAQEDDRMYKRAAEEEAEVEVLVGEEESSGSESSGESSGSETSGESSGESAEAGEEESGGEEVAEEEEMEGLSELEEQLNLLDSGTIVTSNGSIRAIFVAVYAVLIVLVLGGNGLVLYLTRADPDVRKHRSSYYFYNFLAARMSLALFSLPMRIASFYTEATVAVFMCKFNMLFHNAGNFCALYTLAFYVHHKYKSMSGKVTDAFKRSKIVIIVLWICGLSYGFAVFWLTGLYEVANGMYMCCPLETKGYVLYNKVFAIVDYFVFFAGPYFLHIFSARKILKLMRKSKIPCNLFLPFLRTFGVLILVNFLCVGCSISYYLYVSFFSAGHRLRYLENLQLYENAMHAVSHCNGILSVLLLFCYRHDLRRAARKVILNKDTQPIISPWERGVSKSAMNKVDPKYTSIYTTSKNAHDLSLVVSEL